MLQTWRERLVRALLLWAALDPGAGFMTIALEALAVVFSTCVLESVDIGNLQVMHTILAVQTMSLVRSIFWECTGVVR